MVVAVDALLDHPETSSHCRVCAVAPRPGQLNLFEDDARGSHTPTTVDVGVRLGGMLGLPQVATSGCGRAGFWQEQTPEVFGARTGVGSLMVFPDTNILIEIRKEIAEIEGGAGLIVNPNWSARETPVDALRDLIQLWWWRDVRFIASEIHLTDARKPLSPDRRRAREAAVRELQLDYLERGGSGVVVADGLALVDGLCAMHARKTSPRPSGAASGEWRWPPHRHDRELAQEAYDAGAHVFLTTDQKVLACHKVLVRRGLAILSPTQLIQKLDASGELDSTRGGHFPAPDISALSRLYSGFGL